VASDSEWQKQVPDMDAAAVGQIPTQTHTANHHRHHHIIIVIIIAIAMASG